MGLLSIEVISEHVVLSDCSLSIKLEPAKLAAAPISIKALVEKQVPL